MTEKEEKAIKNLKEIIDLSKEEIENNDENTTVILDITDLKSLAIVLEALEQKDKEVSELKAKYDKDTHTLQNQLDLANADRVEKDKIIKAMAKYINSTDKDEDVCRETGDTFNCTEYRNCEECIINFFKKKVSEEKIK